MKKRLVCRYSHAKAFSEDTLCTILGMAISKLLFRIPTSLGSRPSSSLRRSGIPMNFLLSHTQALFAFTTSLRVTHGARDLHVLAQEVPCKVVPRTCSLLICREYLWCDILGSVWKRSRFALECFMSWGGHVLTRLCGFAIPHINVGGEREASVLTLQVVGGLWSENKSQQK